MWLSKVSPSVLNLTVPSSQYCMISRRLGEAFFDAEAFEGFAELATVFPVVRNDDTTRFGLSVDIQLYVSHAFPGMLVC